MSTVLLTRRRENSRGFSVELAGGRTMGEFWILIQYETIVRDSQTHLEETHVEP